MLVGLVRKVKEKLLLFLVVGGLTHFMVKVRVLPVSLGTVSVYLFVPSKVGFSVEGVGVSQESISAGICTSK